MDKKEFKPQELIEHKGQTFRRLGSLKLKNAVFSIWFLHTFPEEENPELALFCVGFGSRLDTFEYTGGDKRSPIEFNYYKKVIALFFYEGAPSKYHCPSEHISLN